VPTVPLAGETVTLAFTVKLVEAVADAESAAVMVSAPLEALGTVNVADQLPFAATVWVAMVRLPPVVKVTLLVLTVWPVV
jgi:hypothetical protein